MTDDADIHTRPRPACPVCGGPGGRFQTDQPDRMFGVPGRWTTRRCDRDSCRTVWLDPCPVPDDIPKLYRSYHTHAAARPAVPVHRVWEWLSRRVFPLTLGYPGRWTLVGRAAAAVAPLRERLESDMLWVPGPPAGRLLDVGCGSGDVLLALRRWGWSVCGVEPDPAAAAAARAQGLDVRTGFVTDLPADGGPFDAVVLSHVIEHVADPVGTLAACGRVLRPGGRLYVVTPNAGSDGAGLFGPAWRGWEVPRHFQVFTAGGLRDVIAAAGLCPVSVRTSARLGWVMYHMSEQLRRTGRLPGGRATLAPGRVLPALLFHLRGYRRAARGPAGEELLAVAEKPAGGPPS